MLGQWGAFNRIEKAIKQDWVVQVLENTAQAWGSRYVQVEADLAGVIEWIYENALASGSATALSRKLLPNARLPELESFLLDFDRQQESAGESRSEDTAWAAAQEHFDENVIPRAIVRAARKAVGCLGKPGKSLFTPQNERRDFGAIYGVITATRFRRLMSFCGSRAEIEWRGQGAAPLVKRFDSA